MKLTIVLSALPVLGLASADYDCPTAHDTKVTTGGHLFRVDCNSNIIGEDIERFYSPNGLENCAIACAEKADICKGATWVEPTQQCILKSTIDENALGSQVRSVYLAEVGEGELKNGEV